MPITLVKETPRSKTIKIVTEDEIQTTKYNKIAKANCYRYECLLNHSISMIGYVRSLLLEGYEVVSNGSM